MSDKVLLDTNLWIYLYSKDPEKNLKINKRYGYSYWDSLIIATALQSNCSILYSEDMQHGQLIATLTMAASLINPDQSFALWAILLSAATIR